ncbi:MAG TPA: hypothetical protein VHQ48_10265 [Bradyrhizobium sp.]|jgi:hypothetical protein|nr:hypothetical protein [Bradyrhizobium sp.]
MEVAWNRRNKPANASVNEGIGALVSELRKMSRMKRHAFKSIPAEQLWSFPQSAATDQAEPATPAGNFGAQLQKFRQLNDYCDAAVAEIRASLARSQDEGH